MSHIWSTVIFKKAMTMTYLKKPSNEILHFGKRKIKSSKLDPHTIADPMLFNHQDKLFIFAEVQRYKENGFIIVGQLQMDINGSIMVLFCKKVFIYRSL